MAEKRMFSKSIIDSDAFLDMPVSARLLYFDLGMRADDDGFVNNPRKIMRITGSSLDDMNILISKKFIIAFESGVIVIKHWRINNYLRSDRYKETTYSEEKAMLQIEKNGTYKQIDDSGIPLGIPPVDADKNSIDKNSIDKNSIDKNSVEEKRKRFVPPTKEDIVSYCEESNLSLDADKFIDYYTANGWMVGKNKMKDWKATVRNWARRDKPDIKSKEGHDIDDFIIPF